VVTSHEYLPFGEDWITEGDTKNAPKYNSQELDKESGYYFYNARHYDPEIGRFVTADNQIDGQYDTQGWNRYSYVKNNPIIYKDPTGHNAVTDFLGNVASGVKEQATSIKDSVVNAVSNPKETGSRIVSAASNKIKEYAKEPTKLVTDYGKALAGPLYTGCEKVYNIATAENKGKQLGKELVNTGLEVGLTAATIGAGKLIGKAAQSLQGSGAATRESTEIVQRAMSRAELEATRETGLLRGGRDGTHYVSDAVNANANRARQRLALDRTPEVKVSIEVPSGKFSPPTRVDPLNNMPGGGLERTAVGDIPVNILKIWGLK
jgi:RHS repeat-associated protein